MNRFVPVFVFVAFTLGATMAWGQVPQLISYQGVLANNAGQLVSNGNYDITFRIFSSVTGGSALHDETHVGVPVTTGGFSVLIGSWVFTVTNSLTLAAALTGQWVMSRNRQRIAPKRT